MKMATGGDELKIPRNNATAYIVYGRRGDLSPEQRINMMGNRAMILEAGIDPTDRFWPVAGCGVILLDYSGLPESTAMRLGLALKRDGAGGSTWANFVTGITSTII